MSEHAPGHPGRVSAQCSDVCVRPLQRGVADIQALMAYMGAQWCGTPEDTVAALDHTLQAMAYLLNGKNECVKKASKVTCHVLNFCHYQPY